VLGERLFVQNDGRGGPAGPSDPVRPSGPAGPAGPNEVPSVLAERRDLSARLRPRYQAEIAAGVEKLLAARRVDCPWCGSAQIAFRAAGGDTALRKPGHFVYDHCLDCGHLFQNPRLRDEGLEFYYRDFYDGLGGEWMEEIFAISDRPYLARLATGLRHARPRRWLDVGAGHGHFCLAARGVLPGTTFDALDMGPSIEEAQRRGWVDRIYRGMLPDLADEIAGRYDMISMFHYFEHVTDPVAELDALARALPVGGHVLIEVPNPESLAFRLLSSYWVGLQPSQHLHLLPADNLAAGLAERGLRPLEVSFGRAHTGGDLAAGVFFLLQRLAPIPDLPWLPREATPARWAAHAATAAALTGPFLAAAALDTALVPYSRSGRRASAYRIVARKEG
jgi:SAM-dependent methyltransferase